MSEAPDDLVERLQVIADLRPGEMMPDWLFINPDNWSNWGDGMSNLLKEAIAEINRLRRLVYGAP